MKPYLALYNLASAAGWAFVLFITVTKYLAKAAPEALWQDVQLPLKIVQTAAVLEVFHSLFGLVRSPLMTTIMQVASRVILLWCYTAQSIDDQKHWSLYLMVGSWAAVEVPRYIFYAVNLYSKNVPFPLFFLRYNLFIVLYPSGISGEVFQMTTALPSLGNLTGKLTLTLLAVYVPSAPFMVMNMFTQRNRASKARSGGGVIAGKPSPAASGLVFPPSPDGDRSTTAAGKAIFAASLATVSPDAAARVEKEKNWRFGYSKHVIANVEASLASPDAALAIAKAGLEATFSSFELIRGSETMSFKSALANIKGSFFTGVLKGKGTLPKPPVLGVPYKNTILTEQSLLEQLKKWSDYGTIEPSARDAIAWVANNPSSLDLSRRYFVLLGAGSAMGPLQVLLALGANVIAVDLDREGIWERLFKTVEQSPGTLIFPLSKPSAEIGSSTAQLAKFAGCNLFTQAPEIKNWIIETEPTQDLIVGGYAYLDGALHVQVSLAMVGIMEGVMTARPKSTFAFLCSPTDVFVLPDEAPAAIKQNLKNMPLWQKIVQVLSGGRVLKPNLRSPVNGFTVVNGIVVAQGPNYALAKRLQHWFAIKARSAGVRVSSNIAPSTATASVVHNASFQAAYEGFYLFKPMEVFQQQTSNAVMGALLIHDVANPESVTNPNTPLKNNILLFTPGAFHGGIWRNAFTIDSIGVVAASAYYAKRYAGPITGVLAGIVAWAAWLVN